MLSATSRSRTAPTTPGSSCSCFMLLGAWSRLFFNLRHAGPNGLVDPREPRSRSSARLASTPTRRRAARGRRRRRSRSRRCSRSSPSGALRATRCTRRRPASRAHRPGSCSRRPSRSSRRPTAIETVGRRTRVDAARKRDRDDRASERRARGSPGREDEVGLADARDRRGRVRLRRAPRGGGGAADGRRVPAAPAARVADHPCALERRGGLDPVRRSRPRARPGERDELSAPRRDRALSGRRQRDRDPPGLRLRELREQGGTARRQPLRHDRRGQRAPAGARAGASSGRARSRSSSASASQLARRGRERLDAERRRPRRGLLVRGVADAAVPAAHEQHARVHARASPARRRRDRRPRPAPEPRARAARALRAGRPGPEGSSRPRRGTARGRDRARRAAGRGGRRRGRGRRPTARTREGITLVPPGSTSSWPIVATAPSIARATSRARSTNSAAAQSASSRASIGVVPAWPARPERTTRRRAYATIDVTIPSGVSRASSTGPCSMCSSTNAPGSRAPGLATRPRLPAHPRSSSRKATTASVRSCVSAVPTASSPATTPSAPSNRPPRGTVSRCEPVQVSSSSGRVPRRRPTRLPSGSTSTSSPASSIHPAARRCASSSSGVSPTRFAPGPPPIA